RGWSRFAQIWPCLPLQGERWSLILSGSERSVGVVYATGSLGDRALQARRLYGDVLGEKPRERGSSGFAVACAEARERFFRQHAAPGRIAEQPQIRCGPGKRGVGRFLREQPLRRAFKAVDGFAEPCGGLTERGFVAGAH